MFDRHTTANTSWSEAQAVEELKKLASVRGKMGLKVTNGRGERQERFRIAEGPTYRLVAKR
jgi:hypothetical protein